MAVIPILEIPMEHFVLKMVLVFILIQLSSEKVKSFAEITDKRILYVFTFTENRVLFHKLEIGL